MRGGSPASSSTRVSPSPRLTIAEIARLRDRRRAGRGAGERAAELLGGVVAPRTELGVDERRCGRAARCRRCCGSRARRAGPRDRARRWWSACRRRPTRSDRSRSRASSANRPARGAPTTSSSAVGVVLSARGGGAAASSSRSTGSSVGSGPVVARPGRRGVARHRVGLIRRSAIRSSETTSSPRSRIDDVLRADAGRDLERDRAPCRRPATSTSTRCSTSARSRYSVSSSLALAGGAAAGRAPQPATHSATRAATSARSVTMCRRRCTSRPACRCAGDVHPVLLRSAARRAAPLWSSASRCHTGHRHRYSRTTTSAAACALFSSFELDRLVDRVRRARRSCTSIAWRSPAMSASRREPDPRAARRSTRSGSSLTISSRAGAAPEQPHAAVGQHGRRRDVDLDRDLGVAAPGPAAVELVAVGAGVGLEARRWIRHRLVGDDRARLGARRAGGISSTCTVSPRPSRTCAGTTKRAGRRRAAPRPPALRRPRRVDQRELGVVEARAGRVLDRRPRREVERLAGLVEHREVVGASTTCPSAR